MEPSNAGTINGFRFVGRIGRQPIVSQGREKRVKILAPNSPTSWRANRSKPETFAGTQK
jgi:hypothetical protein